MPATIGSGPGSFTSREQAVSYYASILAQLPGTYQGNDQQYVGKTWSQLYVEIADADKTADPTQLARAVLGVEAAQRTGQNLQAAGNGLGKFTSASEKAVGQTNFAAGVPNPLSGMLAPLSHLAAVFDAVYHQITKASMWRSLGWIVLGGILIMAGILWWAKTESSGFVGGVIKDVI